MAEVSPTDGGSSQWDDPELVLEQWDRYEKIAMHFNDLLMRFRSQALAGMAAVSALAAVLAKGGNDVTNGKLAVFFVALLAVWIAIGMLDLGYYQPLLAGAVREIVEFEKRTAGRIRISTGIERRMGGQSWRKVPCRFYGIIAAILLALSISAMWFR